VTKKLKAMMTPKKTSAKKKRRRKRVPTKDQCLHRGVKFKPGIGDKRAMELLYDFCKVQGRPVPAINLFMEDPCADFCINMYAELASWSYKDLNSFIEEITGELVKHTEHASLLGTVKCIFHALFTDNEETTQAALLRYDSKWKMWPGKVRLKPRRKRKSDMAKKKAAKKKASKKAAVNKKATAKKTRTQKKTAKKGAKKKAVTRENGIQVHEGAVTKMLKRRSGASVMEVVDKVGISKKSVRKLFGQLKAKKMEEAGRYSL